MAIKKLFPAQEDSEKVFLLIRRHWFTYSIFWLLSFLMLLPVVAVIVIWIGGFLEISQAVGNLIILGGSVYLLGLLALLLYGFVDYYLDVYIVTDRRIVDIRQNGFFKREISELFLTEVQDVNAKVVGFLPTVLHFGEVIIQTAGEIDNFMFNSVPHPYQVSKTIMDLHEKIVSEFSDEGDGGDRKHEHISEAELSKGRFSKDAVKSTRDFFQEDETKKKKKEKEKEEDCECDTKSYNDKVEKSTTDKIIDQKDVDPEEDVEVMKKYDMESMPEPETSIREGIESKITDRSDNLLAQNSEEGILEEGRQIEIK